MESELLMRIHLFKDVLRCVISTVVEAWVVSGPNDGCELRPCHHFGQVHPRVHLAHMDRPRCQGAGSPDTDARAMPQPISKPWSSDCGGSQAIDRGLQPGCRSRCRPPNQVPPGTKCKPAGSPAVRQPPALVTGKRRVQRSWRSQKKSS